MKGWFGLLASFFPNEPVDFGELFFLELFSFLHLFDDFCELFVVLPTFTVFD